MGLFSKDIQSFEDLFVHGLKDIYYAENQIVVALPKMIESARRPELKRAFQQHLNETKAQVERVEQVFAMLGLKSESGKCPAIDGIISEGEQVMKEVADEKVLDAAIIAAAQAVEHYEITRYGALMAWAAELGRSDCARMLQRTLAEEKTTDKKLTALAEKRVNPRTQRSTNRRKKPPRSVAHSRVSRNAKRKSTKTRAKSSGR